MRTLSIIRNTILFAAAVITIWAMLHAATFEGNGLSTAWFLLWGVAPYLLFGVAAYVLERFTRLKAIGWIGLVISGLMLVCTGLAYLATLGDMSSTYALVFVVVPIYLVAGSFILLGLGALISWFAAKR
ncbi:MAG: hypothetical protein ABJA02_06660 [Acidobacteriota bacterium]